MKLTTFNPETTPNVRMAAQNPFVSINIKTGVFSLNNAACELLKVQHGDNVVMHQDEEETLDWYFEKVKSNGYQLRGKNGTVSPLCFNNTGLSKLLLDCVEMPEDATSIKFPIAKEATEFEGNQLFGILLTSGTCKTPNE